MLMFASFSSLRVCACVSVCVCYVCSCICLGVSVYRCVLNAFLLVWVGVCVFVCIAFGAFGRVCMCVYTGEYVGHVRLAQKAVRMLLDWIGTAVLLSSWRSFCGDWIWISVNEPSIQEI